ncbi:MAG: hypothetical protein NXY57DRAFT_1040177 [Lentinula lateritia]|nr:MAG: hypothetical protein NXY57DRAFT_1040177 [Lentinula lateritia]
MDWPSFRLSLSLYLPPLTLLTLGVPGSSISNGAVAAASSLSSLIAAFNNLDPDYLKVVRTTLDSQELALSLLEMQCQQALDAMDIDGLSADSPTALPSEEIEIDGQKFKIVYPSEPQPSDTLALPGSYEKDTGVFHATYRDLNTLKHSALIEICRKYELGTQGNMRVLKEKLIGFSENKIRWQCGGITKNKPATNTGPAAVPSKAKKLKLSTVRRNEMMGLPPDAPLGAQLSDTKHSKDMRTLEQKNRLLSWAKTFCDKHPYVTREELAQRQKIKEEQRARENTTSMAKVAEYMHSMIEHVTSLRVEIQTLKTGLPPPLLPRVPFPIGAPPLTTPASITAGHVLPLKVWTTNTGLQMPASSAAIGASPGDSITPTHANNSGSFSNAQNSGKSNADTQSAANIPKSSDNSTKPSDNSTKPPDNSTTSTDEYERVYVLTVGLGRIVHYKECDLREPPSITFASNIPRLDHVWDDERPSWDPEDCGKNLLSINGTPITLRGKKSSVWASLKKLWSEWKYVAERYRASSPDEFWKEFSFSDGRRFHWKAISDQLCDLWSKHEQQLVDKAKAEYGADFAWVFVNNRGKVLTDKLAISRHYLDKLANRLG